MNRAPNALEAYKSRNGVDVLVFPTFLDLKEIIASGVATGAQCGHPSDHGAHTGDVSMEMIKQLGCTHVLCGHSERRQHHDESNTFVAKQVVSALTHELHPVLCVGETEEERNDGKEKEVVEGQLKTVLLAVENSDTPLPSSAFTIAYEPVWAIGTGNTATPEDAQEMHAYIRSLLPDGKNTRILYGGSMKPENAEELLKQSDIDGGLVGGASLVPEKFAEIINIAG